ncbi:hypothetical protein MTO96_015839 [Rhipicephalus appendiculatus]
MMGPCSTSLCHAAYSDHTRAWSSGRVRAVHASPKQLALSRKRKERNLQSINVNRSVGTTRSAAARGDSKINEHRKQGGRPTDATSTERPRISGRPCIPADAVGR